MSLPVKNAVYEYLEISNHNMNSYATHITCFFAKPIEYAHKIFILPLF